MIYLDPGVSCRGPGVFVTDLRTRCKIRKQTFMEIVWALLLMTSPIQLIIKFVLRDSGEDHKQVVALPQRFTTAL